MSSQNHPHHQPRARAFVRRIALWTAVAVSLGLLTAFNGGTAAADSAPKDPTDPATPVTVSADALPTAQINGVVWSQAVAGDRVYAGGNFSSARPAGAAAGTSEVPRSNLMSYSISTGELVSSFAPTVNAQVRTVATSPDKTRLYVGGSFTTVNGQTRNRIAAFDLPSGQLVADFAPPVNYDVYAIAATNSTVYVGGDFQGVGTRARGYLAAFDASTGALLDWAPQAAGGKVWALALNPGATRLAVAGQFTSLNGSSNPGYGLGLVDTTTGASLPMAVNSVVRNGGSQAGITSLSADGDNFYGGGYHFGAGGSLEGVFGASWSGATTFVDDCHGDIYSTFPRGGAVYAAGHTHYCGNIDGFPQTTPDWSFYRGIAFGKVATGTATREPYGYYDFTGQPTSSLLTWFPSINAGTFTGQAQGPWSVAGNDDYVVMAGEFTKVNNKAQQGLVRFPRKELSPNAQGPSVFSTAYPLNVSSTEAGKARINWTTNQDLDNDNLTYKVYRDVQQKSGLVHQIDARASFWNPYTMGFTDSGLEPGSTHQYRVAVTDPVGNIANSPWVTVTVASTGTDSNYLKAVYASQPVNYWRLGETSGTTAADRVGFAPLTTGSGVTKGGGSGISGDADGSASFNATGNGVGYTAKAINPPNVLSLEGWFKTDSTTGGKLIGFGDRQTGQSSNYDRHLYLDNAGRVTFGVYDGATKVVTSGSTYRDNTWHHVVGTLGKTGMKLYVDGGLVGQNANGTYGQGGFWGYWRIGGDNLGGWPSGPSNNYYKGLLDEMAVYSRELTAAEVSAHYTAGTGVNVSPVASFSSAVSDLTATVDASASADADGTISSYAWTFGDGATATGVTASRSYTAAGTYPVTLTVTDNLGATSSLTKQVKVTAPNVPPVAAFTTTVSQLDLLVDGSSSTDSDGTVASYAWTFGDGATATGASATHSYVEAGTYPVSLVVTDNAGASTTLTKQVVITGPAAPYARDAFNRSVSSGWGNADVGGAWVRTGTATNFAVSPGAGTIRMGSAGAGPAMSLPTVSSTDTEVRTRAQVDKAPTGGGVYLTVKPRILSNGNGYYADTRLLANGTVVLALGRTVSGTDTAVQTKTVTGLSYAVGDQLNLRVQASGTSTTTLRAKVWKVGTTEPTSWSATVDDTTAALQTAGGVGVGSYLTSSATNAPVVASFAELWAGPTN